MIYEVKNEQTGKAEYVASAYHVWLTGVYASKRAAKYAFRFKTKDLYELWIKHCPNALTFEQMREFRKAKRK